MESKNDAAIVASSTSIGLVQRAQQIDHRVREIADATKRSFVELGVLLIEAENKGLHEFLADENGNPYRSHDHWLSVALPYCRSTAYAAKRVVRELSDIPLRELRDVPRGNLEVLRLLPQSERKHEVWVEKAKTLSHDDFLAEAREQLPDLHLEERRKMVLNFSETDHATVNEAISQFQISEGTESREAAITAWAQEYLSR
jgi:hypothetical protein